MMEHPICDFLKLANEAINDLTSVKNIVGERIEIDNETTIIPISKVKCTFLAGGSEYSKDKNITKLPFGGASGGNVMVTPISFLIIKNGDVRMQCIDDNTSFDKAIDNIPRIINKINEVITKKENNC